MAIKSKVLNNCQNKPSIWPSALTEILSAEGVLGRAGHDHDIATNRNNKFRTCSKSQFPDGDNMITWRSHQQRVSRKTILSFRHANSGNADIAVGRPQIVGTYFHVGHNVRSAINFLGNTLRSSATESCHHCTSN